MLLRRARSNQTVDVQRNLPFSGPAMRISQLSKPEEGEAHTDSVWSCVWTPAGNQLITASVDETVSVYSDDQGKLSRYHAYPGHTLGAISVAVDPTGEFAASSALDSYIRWGNRGR